MAKTSRKKSSTSEYAEKHPYNFRSSSASLLGINFKDNPEQQELIRLIHDNDHPVIYCFGNAGTGKTFCATAAALDLVKIQKKYSRIYYIREPLEVGHSLGYIPGDVNDKFSIYTEGLNDNLNAIHEFSGISVGDLKSKIECLAPQYTRGRSFPAESIVIIDEAQNLSLDSIQTLLTRIGKYSKVIMLGSCNQIDIRNKTKTNNDFLISYEILSGIKDDRFSVASVTLVKSERSEFCAIIDEAITQYKENKEKKSS